MVLVRHYAVHTRTLYSTNTAILFEDGKPALRVCVEVESGQGDAGQP